MALINRNAVIPIKPKVMGYNDLKVSVQRIEEAVRIDCWGDNWLSDLIRDVCAHALAVTEKK